MNIPFTAAIRLAQLCVNVIGVCVTVTVVRYCLLASLLSFLVDQIVCSPSCAALDCLFGLGPLLCLFASSNMVRTKRECRENVACATFNIVRTTVLCGT